MTGAEPGPDLALIAHPRVAVRTAGSGQSEPIAECTVCPWARRRDRGAQWLAVRAAARRHVIATGHPVAAGVRTDYVYVPVVASEPGPRP